jgi:hypothetical protein
MGSRPSFIGRISTTVCRELSAADDRLLRYELASQIEHDVLRFSDPTKGAVLAIALKHFDHG